MGGYISALHVFKWQMNNADSSAVLTMSGLSRQHLANRVSSTVLPGEVQGSFSWFPTTRLSCGWGRDAPLTICPSLPVTDKGWPSPYHLWSSGKQPCSWPGQYSRADPIGRDSGELALCGCEWDNWQHLHHLQSWGQGKDALPSCPCHLWWAKEPILSLHSKQGCMQIECKMTQGLLMKNILIMQIIPIWILKTI